MMHRIIQIVMVGLLILVLSCSLAIPAEKTKQAIDQGIKQETKQVQEPVFNVVSINTSPDLIMVGSNLTITAHVAIANSPSGEYSAILKIDNNQIAEKKIKVSQTSLAEVAFVVPVKEFGEHEITIGNRSILFKALVFDKENPVTIKYDGLGEGVQTFTYQGMFIQGDAGHIVWFTAPGYPFKVTAISMKAGAIAKNFSPLDDKFFTVTLWDKKTGKSIWSKKYSWKIYEAGSNGGTRWEDIQIPDVIVKDDFLVEVVTYSDPPDNRYKYVGGTEIGTVSSMALGYENTQNATIRSSISFNGRFLAETNFKGNWNIRVTGNTLSIIKSP